MFLPFLFLLEDYLSVRVVFTLAVFLLLNFVQVISLAYTMSFMIKITIQYIHTCFDFCSCMDMEVSGNFFVEI